MKNYQHTQSSPLIVGITVGTFFILFALGVFVLKPFLITSPLLLIAGWLFHSLTIEITDRELRWHFGIGLIRKRVALADIASVKIVRTNFCEGWGIHWSRFGWLYNVSGYDAIAVTLHSGKRFALGTDEPQVLAAQLNQTLQQG
ncbi:MAG: hypothetical protein RLZZ350_2372 [Verrucomicrobiota bacterium]|jgi:hypothetical protein